MDWRLGFELEGIVAMSKFAASYFGELAEA